MHAPEWLICLGDEKAILGFSIGSLRTGLQGDEWAHLGSNQGPISYEPTALTAELWALAEGIISYLMRPGKGLVSSL